MTAKPQSDVQQIMGTASLVAVGGAIQMVGGFVTVPMLIRAVGSDGYGVLVLITAMLGYTRLITFGTPTAIRNHVSRYHAAKQVGDINQLVSALQCVYLLILAVCLVLAGVLCLYSPGAIHLLVRDYAYPDALPMTVVAMLAMGLINTFLGGICTNIFYGIDRISALTYFESGVAIVQTLAYLVFLIPRPNIIQVAMFQLVASVVVVVARYVFLRSVLTGFRLVYPRHPLKALAAIRNSGAAFAALSVLQVIQETSINLLISALYAVTPLAEYNVANKLFWAVSAAWPIAFTTWPKVAWQHQQGNLNELRTLFGRVLRLNVLTKAVFFVPIAVFGSDLITLWLGPNMAGDAWLYYLLLGVWVTNALTGITTTFILGMSLEGKLFLPNLFSTIVRIVLMIGLFYGWRRDLTAFVLGALLTQIMYAAPLFRILDRQLGVRVYRLALRHLWKIAVLGAGLSVSQLVLGLLELAPHAYYGSAGAMLLAYFWMVCRWVCTVSERRWVAANVSDRFSRWIPSATTG